MSCSFLFFIAFVSFTHQSQCSNLCHCFFSKTYFFWLVTTNVSSSSMVFFSHLFFFVSFTASYAFLFSQRLQGRHLWFTNPSPPWLTTVKQAVFCFLGAALLSGTPLLSCIFKPLVRSTSHVDDMIYMVIHKQKG